MGDLRGEFKELQLAALALEIAATSLDNLSDSVKYGGLFGFLETTALLSALSYTTKMKQS